MISSALCCSVKHTMLHMQLFYSYLHADTLDLNALIWDAPPFPPFVYSVWSKSERSKTRPGPDKRPRCWLWWQLWEHGRDSAAGFCHFSLSLIVIRRDGNRRCRLSPLLLSISPFSMNIIQVWTHTLLTLIFCRCYFICSLSFILFSLLIPLWFFSGQRYVDTVCPPNFFCFLCSLCFGMPNDLWKLAFLFLIDQFLTRSAHRPDQQESNGGSGRKNWFASDLLQFLVFPRKMTENLQISQNNIRVCCHLYTHWNITPYF